MDKMDINKGNPKMKQLKYLLLALSLCGLFNIYSAEMRCGWLVNPTPQNTWLTDKDGDWIISSQGNHLIGIDDDASYEQLDSFLKDENNYVYTNKGAGYGFGCACLTVDVDKKNNSIQKIHKAKQLLLKQCLEDEAIAGKILR